MVTRQDTYAFMTRKEQFQVKVAHYLDVHSCMCALLEFIILDDFVESLTVFEYWWGGRLDMLWLIAVIEILPMLSRV